MLGKSYCVTKFSEILPFDILFTLNELICNKNRCPTFIMHGTMDEVGE